MKFGMTLKTLTYSLALVAPAMGLTSTALANDKVTITISQTIKSSKTRFDVVDKAKWLYQASSNQTVALKKIRATGSGSIGSAVATALRKDEEVVDNDVIGKEIGGHSLISLAQLKGSSDPALNMDILVDHEVDGVKLEMAFKQLIPGKFIEGSWQDLFANRSAKIQYTPAGQAAARELHVKRTQAMMDRVVKALTSQLGGAKVKDADISIDYADPDALTVWTATRDTLEMSSSSEVTITAEVTIRFDD